MNLYPDLIAQQITAITPEQLKKWDVKGIILDIDNTLTTHGNPVPSSGVVAWLQLMRENGMKLIILSNNRKERVEPFANGLELDFISNGLKPLKSGFLCCEKVLGIACKNLCMVGDQLLTDIMGGNRAGCKTILVKPIEVESMIFFRLKRSLERFLLRNIPGGSDWSNK